MNKNIRENIVYKTTSAIITRYDGIVITNLNLQGMMKNYNSEL